MSQQAKAYPQASCDKAEGYPKKLKLYPQDKEKSKRDTPEAKAYPQASWDRAEGYTRSQKHIPKQVNAEQRDTPEAKNVSPG